MLELNVCIYSNFLVTPLLFDQIKFQSLLNSAPCNARNNPGFRYWILFSIYNSSISTTCWFSFWLLYIDFYYSAGIHGPSIFFINIHKGYAIVLAFKFFLIPPIVNFKSGYCDKWMQLPWEKWSMKSMTKETFPCMSLI